MSIKKFMYVLCAKMLKICLTCPSLADFTPIVPLYCRLSETSKVSTRSSKVFPSKFGNLSPLQWLTPFLQIMGTLCRIRVLNFSTWSTTFPLHSATGNAWLRGKCMQKSWKPSVPKQSGGKLVNFWANNSVADGDDVDGCNRNGNQKISLSWAFCN